MTRLQSLFALCSLGLAACPGSETTDSTAAARISLSDDEIIAKVYDPVYQTPDYFYVDERADTPRSYTFYIQSPYSFVPATTSIPK